VILLDADFCTTQRPSPNRAPYQHPAERGE